ncbi:MAG: hypothetical protein N2712_07495 [Brevinematales bacterium]|nr:hypothetical protein [Brevinematales bacterium]
MRVAITLITLLFLLATGNFVYSGYENAYSKYIKGDISGAIAEITKDIFNGIRDSRSQLLMVKIYKENIKDYKQGIEYAIEGIRLFPDREREFTLELGELYFLSGKYDRAEQVLLSYNRRYPGDGNCLYLLGRNYFAQGKFHKTVSSLESAIGFGNKTIEVYEFLGKSYRKIGNYNKALEILSFVYNQTKKEELLGIIIEISSIIDVDYSSYITARKTISIPKASSQSIPTTNQNIPRRQSANNLSTSIQQSTIKTEEGTRTQVETTTQSEPHQEQINE